MKITEERPDLTDWVIHFTRNQEDMKAFTLLRTILSTAGLKPGHSLRNGQTTLYGNQPVVCFTEMPLYSFAKYIQNRNDPTKVSPYGVCVKKHELYEAGGRPVIYGLSGDYGRHSQNFFVDGMQYRLLDGDVLPDHEQYRYVAYDPTRENNALDWTHEREWRWKADETLQHHQIWGEDDWVPALPLFLGKSDGGYFSSIGIIVWNEAEARQIANLLLMFRDAGHNDFDTPFDAAVIDSTFIIMLEKVIEEVEISKNTKANRIEDISLRRSPTIFQLKRPHSTETIQKRVKKAVVAAKKAATQAANACYDTAQKNEYGDVMKVKTGSWTH